MKIIYLILLILTPFIQATPTSANKDSVITTTKNITVAGKQIKLTLTISVNLEDNKEFEPQIKQITQLYFQHWPLIASKLNAPIDTIPHELILNFQEKMGHPAHVNGNHMVIEGNHIRQHPDDLSGVFIHELTHFVQNYPPGAPGWFVEGTADYIRYKTFPHSKWAKRNQAHTNKSKPLGAYWNSTAFLLWIEKTYHPNTVSRISRICKDGKYSKNVWKEITGKSLDELIKEYKQS